MLKKFFGPETFRNGNLEGQEQLLKISGPGKIWFKKFFFRGEVRFLKYLNDQKFEKNLIAPNHSEWSNS